MSEEIYKEFSSVESQIKSVNEKIETFSHQKKQMKDALFLFDELKKGSEIKVPIIDGVFMNATIADDTFYLQSSTDIVAAKSNEEIRELINTQYTKTLQVEETLYTKLHDLSKQLDSLQKRLNDVQVSQR